jgi:hypothetical protein
MKLLEITLIFDYFFAGLLVYVGVCYINVLIFRNIYITYIVMDVMMFTLHKQHLVVNSWAHSSYHQDFGSHEVN